MLENRFFQVRRKKTSPAARTVYVSLDRADAIIEGGRHSATWPTIDLQRGILAGCSLRWKNRGEWPFDFAQGKRVTRKRKAVASENEEPG